MVFSPLAYPGYDWMAQAASDLSAVNAPSLALWNRLSALYNSCELLCVMMVCVGIQGRRTRLLRVGIYLFAAMEWVSAVGYRMFPLSDSGYAGAFQDRMHIAATVAVVLLSMALLTVIIVAGVKDRSCRSYGICAAVALGMMLVGALGSVIYNALCEPEFASAAVMTVNGFEIGEPLPNPSYVSGALRDVYQFAVDALPTGEAILLANQELARPVLSLCASAALTLLVSAAGIALFRWKNLKQGEKITMEMRWIVLTAALALRRVFDNILGNAAKYSDGDLAVTLLPDGSVHFENSASKLGKVQAERLCDRFFSVESASGFTGLGLSIARKLTERMGSTIGADYQAGRLRICVSFPE